jgi:glycosyltransferase involved in cell wall biosynthesis
VIYKGIKLRGVRPGNGSAVRQRYGLGRAPVLLYAGVMNEFQRIDLLLEAMVHVAMYEPCAKLLLVVTIPSERHLAGIRRRVAELGISDNVVMTAPQSLEHVPDFLEACDLAVVPRPQSPGFPIKILNYMAAAKPCVLFASSAGGLTHRENAYLVAPDTADALAESIVELLRDAELRGLLGRNGLHFVRSTRDRRLTAQRVCAAYARTLGRAVGEARLNVALPPDDESTLVAPAHAVALGPMIDHSPEVFCDAAVD